MGFSWDRIERWVRNARAVQTAADTASAVADVVNLPGTVALLARDGDGLVREAGDAFMESHLEAEGFWDDEGNFHPGFFDDDGEFWQVDDDDAVRDLNGVRKGLRRRGRDF